VSPSRLRIQTQNPNIVAILRALVLLCDSPAEHDETTVLRVENGSLGSTGRRSHFDPLQIGGRIPSRKTLDIVFGSGVPPACRRIQCGKGNGGDWRGITIRRGYEDRSFRLGSCRCGSRYTTDQKSG